jgi:hypothetical protein
MACHFSAYGTGLSNLPPPTAACSMLILNDRTPIRGHDPEEILCQLKKQNPDRVLLDFQRLPNEECISLAAHLLEALPCPTVMPEVLGKEFNCPVFLPPCPLHRPLQTHIAPWTGRQIWLETAMEETLLRLTPSGITLCPVRQHRSSGSEFHDSQLHCHYTIETDNLEARFHMWRNPEDLKNYLQLAQELGIGNAIGLYQEFREFL